MSDPYSEFLDSMAMEQRQKGSSIYSDDPSRAIDWQFGFLPALRLGHYIGLRGIGASIIDVATDPTLMVGPDLVPKAIGTIGKALSRGTEEGVKIVQEAKTAASAAEELGSAAAEAAPAVPTPQNMVNMERQLGQYREEAMRAAPETILGKAAEHPHVKAVQPREPSPAFAEFQKGEAAPYDPSTAVLDTVQKSADTVLGRGAVDGAAQTNLRENFIAKTQWLKTHADVLTTQLQESTAILPEIEGLDYQKGELVGDMLLDRKKYFLENDIGEHPVEMTNLRPEMADKIPDQAMKLAESIDGSLQRIGGGIAERGVIKQAQKDYMTRIISFPEGSEQIADQALERAASRIGSDVKNFSRFQLGRTIGDFDELKDLAAEKGWKIERDVSKIFPEYIRSMGKKMADLDAVELVGNSRLFHEASGKTAPIVVRDLADVPAEMQKFYVRSKSDAINTFARQQDVLANKALMARQARVIEDVKAGKLDPQAATEKAMGLLSEAMNQPRAGTAYVAKDVYKDLRNLFEQGLTQQKKVGETGLEKAGRITLWLNSVGKRMATSLSAVHAVAITKTAAGIHGVDMLHLPQGLRFAATELEKGGDITEWLVRHGLTLQGLGDVERGALGEGLSKAAGWLRDRHIPIPESAEQVLGKLAKGAMAPQMQLDKFLWDFYHPANKLFAAHEMLFDALRNPKFAALSSSEITRQITSVVNEAFGGLNWNRLWVSKQGLSGLRLLLFAPDWEISNLKLAADVWTGIKKVPPGVRVPYQQLMAGEVGAYYARQYAFRQRLIQAMMGNLGNYAFTAWRTGKGRFMDENPEGFRDRIAMPWTDSKGREQYYDYGKLFREPYDMISLWDSQDGPGKYLRRKLAPVPGAFVTEVTGSDLLGNPIVTSKDGPFHTMVKRFGVFAEPYEPFSVRALRQALVPGTTPVRGQERARSIPGGISSVLGFPVQTGP